MGTKDNEDISNGYNSGYNENNSPILFKNSPRVLKFKAKPPKLNKNY